MPAVENHQGGSFAPQGLQSLAVLALLWLITVGFYWKLVLSDQYTWLESPDLANQVLPWLQYQAGEWHRKTFPAWDPYLWGGQSLMGQAQPGAAYPLNWILFLLPLRNGWLRLVYLHWYFVLVHFLAVVFAYRLARELGCSRAASVLGGVAFGFGGYVGTTDWPQMLNGAIWAPLVFLFLIRSLNGIRPRASAALSGMFLGIAWLSGHHQIPIYMSLAAIGVWAFKIFQQGCPHWRLLRLAAVFLLFTLLTGALQILPAYEYGKLARRWVGVEEPVGWAEKVPYVVHAEYSLDPLSLLGVLIPGVHRHADPFAGITVTTLALLAVATGFRRGQVRLLAVLAASGFLFALGEHNVFHGFIYAVVPLVEKARTPSMAVFIFHFGVSILGACGAESLRSAPSGGWPRRAALALLAAGGVLLAGSAIILMAGKQPDERYALAALIALLAAGLIYGRHRGQISARAALISLLALALIELGNVSGFSFAHKRQKNRSVYLDKMAQHADIAQFLRAQPWPLRVAISDQDIAYNFGDWYGIDVFGGYVASLPDNLLRLGIHSPRVHQLMGVGYYVASKPPEQAGKEVFRSQSGLSVYENRQALPRVWSVHSLVRVAGAEQARALLDDPGFDFTRAAWMTAPLPALESCAEPDTVRLLRRDTQSLEIEARMACKGMVVMSENYFPGWRATVDGKPAPIHEVYTALRGVVVEQGLHRIRLDYRPPSVGLGALGTLVGIIGASVLTWVDRRRTAARAG